MVIWATAILSGAKAFQNIEAKKLAYENAKWEQKHHDKMNLQFANEDLIAGYAALAARRQQESRAIAFSLDQITRDVEKRISSFSVAAGEAGIKSTSGSAAAAINEFKRIQMANEQNLLDTDQFANEQFARESKALHSQTYSRLLQGMMPIPQRPNYMQEFVGFATAMLGSYQKELEFQDKYPTDHL